MRGLPKTLREMPYRRRRRRIPRRRSQFHYRKRRWIHRRRRQFWKRRGRRSSTVRVSRPRHIRVLTIKGVEFLGVQGSSIDYTFVPDNTSEQGTWTIDIKNVAPCSKEVTYFSTIFPLSTEVKDSCQDKWNSKETCYWDFVGGFGQAEFTFRSLIYRTLLGLARFSSKLDGFQFIKFLGYRWTLMRARTIDYILLPEAHRGPNDYEKSLIHPINLLNTPGSVLVQSVNRTKCCRAPKVKKRAEPTIFGWHDIEEFMNVRLTGYVWSVIELDNPIGRNPNITKQLKAPYDNDWMNETNDPQNKTIANYCPKWMNRVDYDKEFVTKVNGFQRSQKENWWDWSQEATPTESKYKYGKQSPFLPTLYPAPFPQTLWFRFNFRFLLAGKTFGRTPPSYPVKETDVCVPCSAGCRACIDPEKDLDATGILKDKALARITRAPQRTKKRMVALLARLIRERKRRRARTVTWADEAQQKKPRFNWGI
ncbi:ORF1 [Grizzly bear anellovirus 8]|nr:ORF1 [Grizzly bear anellovirus 8]